MKTIKDLSIENINKIYSIIVNNESSLGNIEWTLERDFVCATFKIEDCIVSDNYDTVEYGLQINSNLDVDYVWVWKTNKGHTSIEYRPLRNHHSITKYLISEGFNI
jgi:hypothetical protein